MIQVCNSRALKVGSTAGDKEYIFPWEAFMTSLLPPILRRFAERFPIPTMARAVLERRLNPVKLDAWFETVAEEQHARALLFSTLSESMMQVVNRQQPAIHAAHQAARAPLEAPRVIGTSMAGGCPNIGYRSITPTGRARWRCVASACDATNRPATATTPWICWPTVPVWTADACTLARLYRERWTLENAFLHLTVQPRREIDALAYPPAALFGWRWRWWPTTAWR